MKTKWLSLVRIKDILLAAVAITALITVLYTYIGGKFMESSKIAALSAHAGDRDIHLDSLKNEQLRKTVTKEVMDLRFDAVSDKLETLHEKLGRIEKQYEEIKLMFARLLNQRKYP